MDGKMRFCGQTINATNGHFLLNRIWNVSPTEAAALTAARGRSQSCMWQQHFSQIFSGENWEKMDWIFIFGTISHKSVVQYRTLLSVVPLKPAPAATPLRTLSFAELQGIPGLATIKTVVNLKPLQSRALVCQTMMTQCPVRPVMTEIYTLLLEPGPSALPSETPSSLQQAEGGGGRGLRQSNRSQLMH